MSLIRRALTVGLSLALAACAAPLPAAVVKPEGITAVVAPDATIVPEMFVKVEKASAAVVLEAIAVPVADEAPQDPALLAVGSGQPVFIEFYTDW